MHNANAGSEAVDDDAETAKRKELVAGTSDECERIDAAGMAMRPPGIA